MPKQKEIEYDSDQFFSSESEASESEAFESEDEEMDEGVQPESRIRDKDAEEEELEDLVLGNQDTFRKRLFQRDILAGLEDLDKGRELQLVEGERDDSSGPEDVHDSDLFMIDTGPAPSAPGTAATKAPTAQTASADAPAWEDSDDERLAVSLATASRLRKLRIEEGEDVVSGTEYAARLRRQYLALNPLPKWAKEAQSHPAKRRRRSSNASDTSSGASGSDDEAVTAQPLDDFLRDSAQMSRLGSKTKTLKPEVIDIQRTRDIPDKHADAVTSISFHPKFPILLSSSPSSLLFLHHLDATAHPTPNPKLTSVKAHQVDVRRSEFRLPYGDKIFFAGRRRFFHTWDLETGAVQRIHRIQGHRLEHKTMEHFRISPCGQYIGMIGSTRKGGGVINVLSVATSQWIASARMESRGGVADFAWWRNSQGMTILGKNGHLGEWNLITKRFTGIWRDEGSVGAIVVALGGNRGPEYIGEDRWIAVGSNTGIMNVYDRLELVKSVDEDGDVRITELPEPKRRFEQLVTPITAITFSPDGQLLAFASQPQKDAFRLVHLPSCTVYRNWPTEQTPLGRVTAVAFGGKSDVLAVGNDKGKIRLWDIRH